MLLAMARAQAEEPLRAEVADPAPAAGGLAQLYECPAEFPVDCDTYCCEAGHYCTADGGCCPYGTYASGDGYCVPEGHPYCGNGKYCYPGDTIACGSTGQCYLGARDAVDAGCPVWDHVVCGSPVQ